MVHMTDTDRRTQCRGATGDGAANVAHYDGGQRAQTEVKRMITEKAAALSKVHVGAAAIMLRGGNQQRLASNTLRVYKRRVRRNKRRLLKRKS